MVITCLYLVSITWYISLVTPGDVLVTALGDGAHVELADDPLDALRQGVLPLAGLRDHQLLDPVLDDIRHLN